MSTRTYVAALLAMMINAVIFGVGAILVVTIPTLWADAWIWLPIVVVISFVTAPFIAWRMAPMLRARYERRRAARQMPHGAARS